MNDDNKVSPSVPMRPFFAAHVLIATLAHPQNMICLGSGNKEAIKNMARDCFIMADAMLLAEQEKP